MMVVRNLRYSATSMVAKAAANIGFLLLIARLLDKSAFGEFSYAFVFATILGLVADYGFSNKFLRDLAHKQADTAVAITAAVYIMFVISAILMIVVVCLFFWPSMAASQFELLLILAIASILNSFGMLFVTPFKCNNRFDVEAKYVAIDSAFLCIAGVAMAWYTREPVPVAIGYMSAKVLFLLLTLRNYRSTYGFARISFSTIRSEAVQGLAFATHFIIGGIYLNVDTIILKEFVPLEDVAIYQAGMRIVVGMGLLLSVVGSVLVPRLTELRLNNRRQLYIETKRYTLVVAGIGLAAFAVMSLFAPITITVLYGSAYQELNGLLWVFGVIVFLRCTGTVYGILLTLGDKQRIRAASVALTLVFICVCDAWAIPRYGIQGAAYVLVLAHVILNAIYIGAVRRDYGTLFLWHGSRLAVNSSKQ